MPDVVRRRAARRRADQPRRSCSPSCSTPPATGIAVGGTSGKSTVTGMIGWILHAAGPRPDGDERRGDEEFRHARRALRQRPGRRRRRLRQRGRRKRRLDRALPARRSPCSTTSRLDHKSLDELRAPVPRLRRPRPRRSVLNLDDDETRLLAAALPPERLRHLQPRRRGGRSVRPTTSTRSRSRSPSTWSTRRAARRPGAPAGARPPQCRQRAGRARRRAGAAGVPLAEAAEALAGFTGLRRRFDWSARPNGVTVIDDFGHNPDKIAATLRTLHAFPGRLLLFFQPHGYGPLRTMRRRADRRLRRRAWRPRTC